jgi:hypothetical protein
LFQALHGEKYLLLLLLPLCIFALPKIFWDFSIDKRERGGNLGFSCASKP